MPRERSANPVVAPKVATKATAAYGGGLSADLIEKGVRRVGFIGALSAATMVASYSSELAVQPERVLVPGHVPLPLIMTCAMVVIGLSVCAAAYSRKVPPALMLDLGLVFEVIGALIISLSENSSAWPTDRPIRGVSWSCIWVAMFAITVPSTLGKTILAAMGAASMSLVGLALGSAINQFPFPNASQLVILLLPTFGAAGWAIPSARHIHMLGAQLSRQREMGSYRLIEPIGRGGMGEVWRAEHRMLARTAAIKLVRAGAGAGNAESELMIKRFDREARATAALRSPHTVTLYDYGVSEDGRFYYVMELLQGADLDMIVSRHGPMPAGRVVYLLKQACKSLAEAHELGLIHRDLKPSNIYLSRMGVEYDFVKILDFGLAKYALEAGDTVSHLTADGAVPGTPAYIAPEAPSGAGAMGPRSDLYSLGCVAYWMLTGRTVFQKESAVAMMMAHIQTPPEPPSAIGVAVPECLERVVMACLEKNPEKRPRSAMELSEMLDACEARPAWTDRDAEEWWRRHEREKQGARV